MSSFHDECDDLAPFYDDHWWISISHWGLFALPLGPVSTDE